MSGWSAMGNGPKVAIIAAGVVFVAVAGYWASSRRPAPMPVPLNEPAALVVTPETSSSPDTSSKDTATAMAPPPAAAKPEPEQKPEPTAPAPPSFDIVRIEQDGSALVAGRASPGSAVSVLIDASEVANVIADASGGFAALFSLPPSEAARLLTLQMRLGDDKSIASDEQVVLSPADVLRPETVAEAPASVEEAPQPSSARAEPTPPESPTLPQGSPTASDTPVAGLPDDNQALLMSPKAHDDAPAPEAAQPEAVAAAIDAPKPENSLALPEQSKAPLGEEQSDTAAAEPVASAPPVIAANEEAADPDEKQAVASPPAPTAPASEPVAPTAILLGPQGVRVLQSSGNVSKGELRPVSIDAISYSSGGAVQLAGRGMPGANVRLYLDNAALTTFVIGLDGGWGGTLPDMPPGLYTLRADQLDEQGKVTARFETPFQRETPEALAAVLEPGPKQPEPSAATVPSQDPIPDPTPSEAAPVPQPIIEAPVASEPTVIEAAPVKQQDTAVDAPPQAVLPAPPAEITSGTVTAPVTPVESETAATAEATQTQVATTKPKPAPVTVTVQPGFTLWAIARDQFGEGFLYVQVYEANKDRIRDPDLIYPGQVFAIPQNADR